MKEETSKKIIERIKQEKIKPKKRVYFAVKRCLFWLALIILVVLGGLFLSLAILSLVDFDLELMRALKIGRYVRLLVFAAPYLWIILLTVSIFLGYYIFRKTKTGYRYSVLMVAIVILLIVSVLGVAAHFFRMNDRMELAISQGLPPLHVLAPPREHRLLRPEEGVLAGMIIEKMENEFKLLTPKDEIWGVLYTENTKCLKQDLEVGNQTIVVIGEKTGERKFVAEQIRRMRKFNKRIEENGKNLKFHQQQRLEQMRGGAR